MAVATLDFLNLATSSDAVLEELMRACAAPALEELVGWEYRGFNSLDLTTPLGFRKFKKGFFRTGQGAVRGYNVKVRQSGLIDPWEDILVGGGAVRHSFYDVYPVRMEERDDLYPQALLLDYACAATPLWSPGRVLRDYLVEVGAGAGGDLLLGKAYVALGPARVFVSYFALERASPSPVTPQAPGGRAGRSSVSGCGRARAR